MKDRETMASGVDQPTEATYATATATPGSTKKTDEPILERGTTLGRYLVLGELGAGGMGMVYTAYDPDLDRKIAIKLMRTAFLDKQGRTRVLREAQAMAKLSHPNVVSVYDVGTHDDQVFIAMELVDGVTLRQWLKAKERTWREIVDVMILAGRGLAAAHEAGLIHRDVKPSNILVDEKGDVRVMDFGVARPMNSTEGEELAASIHRDKADHKEDDSDITGSTDNALSATLTKIGAAIGTPAYMAPEQFKGVTDHSTDQYSFCVTLYECLFGERPEPYDGKRTRSSLSRFSRSGRTFSSLRSRLTGSGRSRITPDTQPSQVSERVSDSASDVSDTEDTPDLTGNFGATGAAEMSGIIGEGAPKQNGPRPTLSARRVARESVGPSNGAAASGAGVEATGVTRASAAEAPTGTGAAPTGSGDAGMTAATRGSKNPFPTALRASGSGRSRRTGPRGRNTAVRDLRVPSWVKSVLRRGLHRESDLRYPSMNALLHELSRDPAARRRRVLTGAGMVAMMGASVAVAATWRSGAPALCKDAPGMLKGVWDDSVKANVTKAFRATGRAHADDSAGRVAAILDRHTGAWVDMRTEACEATQIRGDQSERLLDLRVACLDQRLAETRSLTELFASAGGADGALVDRAIEAALRLSPLDRCADADALTALVPLPEDPAKQTQLRALFERLGAVRAMERAGRYADGVTAAQALADEAGKLEYAPATAEALFALGELQSDAGDAAGAKAAETTLYEAAKKAGEAKNHALVARAATLLIRVVGAQQERHEEALAIATLAEVQVARAGDKPAQRVELLTDRGIVQARIGQREESETSLREAVELAEKELADRPIAAARALTALASTLSAEGKYDDAQAASERALDLWKSTVGAAHPFHAAALGQLGDVLLARDRAEDALSRYEQAQALTQSALGSEHPDVARDLARLGLALERLGKRDQALASLAAALTMYEKTVGEADPRTAGTASQLGELFLARNEPGQALPYCARAAKFGGDDPDSASAIAKARYLACQGAAQLAGAALPQAVESYEQAVKLRERSPGDGAELASFRFRLADALWRANSDRARAVKLAEQARETLTKGGAGQASALASVESWLNDHHMK